MIGQCLGSVTGTAVPVGLQLSDEIIDGEEGPSHPGGFQSAADRGHLRRYSGADVDGALAENHVREGYGGVQGWIVGGGGGAAYLHLRVDVESGGRVRFAECPDGQGQDVIAGPGDRVGPGETQI